MPAAGMPAPVTPAEGGGEHKAAELLSLGSEDAKEPAGRPMEAPPAVDGAGAASTADPPAASTGAAVEAGGVSVEAPAGEGGGRRVLRTVESDGGSVHAEEASNLGGMRLAQAKCLRAFQVCAGACECRRGAGQKADRLAQSRAVPVVLDFIEDKVQDRCYTILVYLCIGTCATSCQAFCVEGWLNVLFGPLVVAVRLCVVEVQ